MSLNSQSIHEIQSRLIEASTHVAIIAVDDTGLVHVFNTGAVRMLGHLASEIVATKPLDCLVFKTELVTTHQLATSMAPAQNAGTMLRVREIAQRTENPSDEWTLVRKDGTHLVVQVDITPIRDESNNNIGFLIVIHDLTIRKRFENQLFEACRKAENANDQKTHYLTHMSHEIRSPLASILGNAELLTDSSLSSSERDSSLKTIQRSGQHLLSLVNNILDLSKIEAGKLTVERCRLSPIQVLEEVIELFQESSKAKQIQLTYEVQGVIPEFIWSDSMRIKQILVNLVNNAIKFTPRGSVKVIVSSIPSESIQPPKLSFRVQDTGIGISDEHQKLLFAPFVQANANTARDYGGTGLGLTICRRIAQLLDGDISVQSALGQGSTFTATIGSGIHDHEVSMDNKDLRTLVQNNPVANIDGRILLVDDSIDIQRLVRAFLTNAGAEVDTADNGQIAIDLILGRQGQGAQSVYDLILMDMQMPVMDGCDTTQELRSRGYTGPIVALTANAMLEDRDRCMAAGFTDFATKPINRRELLAICHNWIT